MWAKPMVCPFVMTAVDADKLISVVWSHGGVNVTCLYPSPLVCVYGGGRRVW